jgi:hypothetical protein
MNSANLSPIRKPDDGVRPIAVGEVPRRLVGKCVLATLLEHEFVKKAFDRVQYGIGMSNGKEVIVHAVASYLDSHSKDNDLCVFQIDIINAFNLGNRDAILRLFADHIKCAAPYVFSLLGDQPYLFIGYVHYILSCMGVQQGDPLGPLLFALLLLMIKFGSGSGQYSFKLMVLDCKYC